MERIKYSITKLIMMLLCLPMFMISCDEEDAVDNTPERLFRPALLTAGVDGNKVRLTWIPIANASYSLEISRDSLLFSTDLQVIPLDGVDEYTVEDLWSDTIYSARIKGLSKISTVKDSEYETVTFRTGIENIFYTVAATDIGTNQVLLKWDKTKSVSTIVVSTAGAADTVVPVSASDAGEKLIPALTAGTSYTFKIYFGEMLRGTVSAKTKP
ncbi:MAG: hypothetical protein AB2L20_18840 [Mangrovibacterium sp.]